MGKFEDYIRSIDTATPLPDGLLGNLQAAYNEDIGLVEAKVSSLDEQIATKDAEVSELKSELTSAKSHNYDLLMNLPKKVDEIPPPAGENVTSIDDLFGDGNGT